MKAAIELQFPKLLDSMLILLLSAGLWGIHAVWLRRDTRPPVWDMALHQSYALNYLQLNPPPRPPFRWWDRLGNYPPFVHLAIALCYYLFHPGPHIAILANIPATLLLLWAVFELGSEVAGAAAGRWACALTALTPYLIWMSRETMLDYWLSAWVGASLVILYKTRGFASRAGSLILGGALALGLLTKWLFLGFVWFPLLYIFIRHRVWRDRERLINAADSLLIAGLVAAVWYLPNLPKLIRYFSENAEIGAIEGEPQAFSAQSLVYYLWLLEGYQLFGPLFLLLLIASFFVLRKKLLRDGNYLWGAIAGGWLVMTLLRTKDPRFTMPLLGLVAIVSGAWIQSWQERRMMKAAKAALVALLVFQAYLVNFGVHWLPQEVVLAQGYQGSLRWDWNLYLQHYFHILGPPRREDWKQREILGRVQADAVQKRIRPSLALVPDLARFNAANFLLQARLDGIPMRVDHLRLPAQGLRTFEGFNYVLMTEGDQGMPWTTSQSRRLNQIIVDEHGIFRLLELFRLPNGDYVRLYSKH